MYNQVYHSSENSEAVQEISNLTEQTDSMSYPSGRYFYNEIPVRESRAAHGRSMPNYHNYNYPVDAHNQLMNLHDRGFSLPQMLCSPINNIVLLPNPPTQVFINNKEPNRRRRWRKKKKKLIESPSPNVSSPSKMDDNKVTKTSTEETIETVNLSDSDDSDVCYIEVKPPLILVSSDDETKTKTESTIIRQKNIASPKGSKQHDAADSDIVFIPTKPKQIDTITVDEDIKSKEDSMFEAPPVHQTPEHIPVINKEILGTPESTMSNDFLESAVEMPQSKFNFGLHGVDFNTKELNKLSDKPAIERSETESSASDISTPIKTAVFNEVPFETPTKNIFNESNLSNFADFIVPKRTQQASTPKNETSLTESICPRLAAASSSDSSSESDYEEINVKSKSRLPSLSVFEEQPQESAADATITVSAPSSSADIQKGLINTNSSRQLTGIKEKEEEGMQQSSKNESMSAVKDENCTVLSSDDENDEDAITIFSSDSNTTKVINMDNYITLDECCSETSTISSKKDERGNAVSIPSESEESIFDVDELEALEEDIQIANCQKILDKGHAFRDKTLKKSTYSFDTVWTSDREKFYKGSWGHENLNVAQVHKTMSGTYFI